MTIGNTNHPSFQTGITSNDSWVNQILSFLSFSDYSGTVSRITSQPSPVLPGQVYLIGAGSTYGSPGTLVIFLTASIGSAMVATPPNGTVAGKYTKSGNDWLQTVFSPSSLVLYTNTVPVTSTLPTDFDGCCQLVIDTTAGVTVNGASGRVNKGLAGTVLTAGIYNVYQSATSCIIN